MGGAAAAASKLSPEDAAAGAKPSAARPGEAQAPESKASKAVTFDPARAGAAASSGPPRRTDSSDDPTRGSSGSKLHVNSRLAPVAGDGPDAEPSGAASHAAPIARSSLAELDEHEEEAMQRAIEASLSENQKIGGLGVDDRRLRPAPAAAAQREAAGAGEGKDARGRAMVEAVKGGIRQHERPPAKAATLGLGGCAWVDNSDFHIPRTNQMLANPEVAHSRSASCNAAPGRGRSTIVSLPQIQKLPPKEQHEMVKGLHESIRETVASPDESPFSGVGSLSELNLEHGREKRDNSVHRANNGPGGFNAQFHSCRNEQDAGQPRWTPRGP